MKFILRALLLAFALAAAVPSAGAQGDAFDMWRTASQPSAGVTASWQSTSSSDGLTVRIDEWVTADGRYARTTTREHDREDLLVTPDGAWRKDWNGFVRTLDSTELARVRGEAFIATALAFGPRDAFATAQTSRDETGATIATVLVDGQPLVWKLDAQTGLPSSVTADGEQTDFTWANGAISRIGDAALPGPPFYVRSSRRGFGPLRAARSDVAMPRARVTIPFTMEANHIIVQTRVNGREAIGFLIDTGAAVSTLNSTRMEGFGVTAYGGGEVEGGGGSASNRFVSGVSYALEGGVEISNQHANAMDLTGLERAWGVKIGGILGYDFISRFVLETDYQNQVLTLHRAEHWRYRGEGVVVPLTFDGGTPYVDATLSVPTRENMPARLLMDNGLADTMVFTRPFVEANDLARLAGGNGAAVNATAGLGNQFFTQNNTRGRIAELRLGDLVLRDIPVNFSTNTSGAYASDFFAATFGNTIFNRYRVFIDYQRKRMIFEPTPAAATPFAERRTFGMTLLAGGDDLRTFTVSGIRAGSPAEAAGFRRDDVIAGVDGREATAFTLQELRDLVLREGEHHAFRVRRGSETLTIEADVTTVSIER
jgi:hypothetical protein